MAQHETGRFTVGVFPDVTWAAKGVEALLERGFPADALSMIVKDGPEAESLVQTSMGGQVSRIELPGLGPVLAVGPLLPAFQVGGAQLERHGLAASLNRVGFQLHDGQIFAALTGRGGVLVAVHSEPRAADALATFYSYGGANAAIGAWTGRV